MPEIDEKLVENILSGNGEENGLKPISLDGSKGTTKESKIGANGDNNDEASGDGSTLLIKKLSEDAKLPQRGSRHAAGLDLFSAEERVVPSKGKVIVPTKLAITVPFGSYGRIAPRSGLASKHFIDVGAGVIDHDYTGEVGVLLFNFSDVDYKVAKHEKVAQLVVEKIFIPELKVVDELPKSFRGDKGYGSSGKH